jgi:C4-type Zn-finger protein
MMQAAATHPPIDFLISHTACPSCGGELQLARTVRGTDGRVDLQTFSCRTCSLWVTEAADKNRH